MSERFDQRDAAWPPRPWIMAAICATAGLLFNLLTDLSSNLAPSPLRQAGATLVAVAAVSFVLTVEQRRWLWSLGFALGWGAVVALIGWFTASYNQHPTIFEFPFLSGVFAVLLAAPLFQTVRDEGAWRFPYARLHGHAWTDAVIGAASLAFVGITFLLAWLIAGLFDVIGIDVIKQLLKEEWFGWMLGGFAFGAAVGLLRERDSLVGTLQRLVMVVLGVLAPVLAVALALFLLSLPFTGLGELRDSSIPATPLMLVAAAGAILLANAVIGNGDEERATNRVLRGSALVLVLCVLPLAVIAALSLGQRIGQYGWTPERIWGVVAVAVALGYGLVGGGEGSRWVRRPAAATPDPARDRNVCGGAAAGAADPRFRRHFGEVAGCALRLRADGARRLRLAGYGVRLRTGGSAAAGADHAQRHTRPAATCPSGARHDRSSSGRGAGPQGRQRGHARGAAASRARRLDASPRAARVHRRHSLLPGRAVRCDFGRRAPGGHRWPVDQG